MNSIRRVPSTPMGLRLGYIYIIYNLIRAVHSAGELNLLSYDRVSRNRRMQFARQNVYKTNADKGRILNQNWNYQLLILFVMGKPVSFCSMYTHLSDLGVV